MNDGSFEKMKDYFGNISQGNKLRREALENDRTLQDLVTYELTEGLTVALVHITDILPKFAEYKALVKRGSFTVAQLEERVLAKYAIVTEPKNEFDWVNFSETEPKKYYRSNNEAN